MDWKPKADKEEVVKEPKTNWLKYSVTRFMIVLIIVLAVLNIPLLFITGASNILMHIVAVLAIIADLAVALLILGAAGSYIWDKLSEWIAEGE